jgi:O-antigen/teichoic acid export membrane protein
VTDADVNRGARGADPPARRQQVQRFVGLTAARGIAAAMSGVWIIIAARQLSLEEFGELSVLLALAVIFVNASDAGIQVVLADHLARAGTVSRPVVLAALRRRMSYSVLGAVAVTALYQFASTSKQVSVPLVFSVSIIATVGHQTLLTAYRATGRVMYDAVNELASRAGVLVLGTAALVAGGGLLAAAAVYSLTDVVSIVVIGLLVVSRLAVRHDPDGIAAPDFRLRHTFPLAVGVTVWMIYLRVDIYILTLLRGPEEAALYGAANRFLDIALLPAVVLGHTILAYVSPLSGRKRLAEVHRYMGAAAAVAAVMALAGTVLATPVLQFFGPDYAAARGAAIILLVSAIPGALVATLAPVAGVTSRHWFGLLAIGALVVNVGLNWAVIPTFGIVGAAWATVASQAAFALALYVLVRKGDTIAIPNREAAGGEPNGVSTC